MNTSTACIAHFGCPERVNTFSEVLKGDTAPQRFVFPKHFLLYEGSFFFNCHGFDLCCGNFCCL